MPEDHKTSNYRFFQWIVVVAFLSLLVTSLPYTWISLLGAELLLGVFMLIDLSLEKRDRYQGCLAFSYFACGLAFAIACSFILVLCFPPEYPLQPRREPMTLLESFAYIFSGGFLLDIGQALAQVLGTIIIYLFYFTVFTLLSFGTAIVGWRKHPSAKWLMLLNSPGMALISYLVVMIVFGEKT